MTAALNWYRASRGHKRVIEEFDVWEVNVPTLLIHGSEDLGERSVTDTASLMKGPYRVVRPDGGHFIVDEQPKVVADETLAHLRCISHKMGPPMKWNGAVSSVHPLREREWPQACCRCITAAVGGH